MIDVTGDKGVMKRIIQTGIGPVMPEGCVVRGRCGFIELIIIKIVVRAVHYNGYLEYADEPYDSTRLRSQPLKIRLGNQEVIPGYGKRKLVININ